MDVPQWPSSDTPQAGQQWLDASSSSTSFQTPKKLHMQSQHDPWLQWMGPLDGSFTFSSVPIEEEPELVHNGHPIEGFSSIDTRLAQFDGGKPQFGVEDRTLPKVGFGPRSRPLSMISLASATSSGSCLSSVQTDVSDANTVIGMSREASPQKAFAVPTPQAYPEHGCNWGGCAAVFKTHTALSWHVKAEHLLICPAAGCDEGPFSSPKLVGAHVDVVHLKKERSVKEWSLEVGQKTVNHDAEEVVVSREKCRERTPVQMGSVIEAKKRKCMDDLDKAVERRAKRAKKLTGSTPTSNTSKPLAEAPSFPMVWEHSVLPFLTTLIPKLSSPRHIISTTRGRTPAHRRINIITPMALSFSKKLIVGKHVRDLLPPPYKEKTSFVFSVGQIERTTWARGLGKGIPDDVCSPRNPYSFTTPAMGDSIGIHAGENFDESTATLGPCITVDGGSYWLGNFHPFLDAYESLDTVAVEHPSPQDRTRCTEQDHDAMTSGSDFKLGDLMVTSGLNLKTTRVSHDPYWEDLGKDSPLVVTDWALISSASSRANILRRFPSDTQALGKEPLITSTSAVEPGAPVLSSGRTSGYQKGQVCEIPAYVSGEENGTQKATREWFIEDPLDNEEAWIRGGIGVEGDSGAPVVDAETNDLVGQVWGRNKYWGPGPRHTFFTPIADIFDDIQEKCGQDARPSLPQHRDEADRFPVYPSCRQCYDLKTYLDSRRSSRMSLQSMIMSPEERVNGDLTSIEAVSELATPRDSGYNSLPRGVGIGVEEAGSSFNIASAFSPGVLSTSAFNDVKSPYAQTLDLSDLPQAGVEDCKKRAAPDGLDVLKQTGAYRVKRSRVEE